MKNWLNFYAKRESVFSLDFRFGPRKYFYQSVPCVVIKTWKKNSGSDNNFIYFVEKFKSRFLRYRLEN